MDLRSCDDFEPASDSVYLNCSLSEDVSCGMLRDLHIAWDFISSPMIIVLIVLSILALVFNLIYTVLIHIVVVRERFKGHKRAVFIANRSIVSILTLSILYTTLILWTTYGFGYLTTSILLVFAACDYMVIANNFFIVTILMYVAVMNPIFYSTRLEFWHCIAIGWGLSLIATIVGICIGLLGAALFFPSESFFECPISTCQYPFTIALLCLISIGYLLMLICYSTVILRLRNRVDKLAQFSLRFSFGIITMAFIPTIVFFVVVMINFDNFSGLGDVSFDPCSRLESGSVLLLCCYLVSSVAIFWLIGMTIDPIFNIVTEAKFYEHFATFRWLRSLVTKSEPIPVLRADKN